MSTERGPILLSLARTAIARSLALPAPRTATAWWLLKPGASFVSLIQESRLRGCVGTMRARRPLAQDVKQNAVAAATRDPRFSSLKPDELESVLIEVSLLSALQELRFASEEDAISQLRPGLDGVFMEYRGQRGTFLPQVWQALPQREEFFTQLKAKTSLPRAFWSNEVKLWRYTIEKWKEDELKAAA
jgi:AmmeMemoRadiSam system protein A